MIKGIAADGVRSYNLRSVLDVIRHHEPVSKAEIAAYTGLSAPAVSTLVGVLLDSRIVLEADKRYGGRGQPAQELTLNPSGGAAIGLHLDRDHVTAMLVDLRGQIQVQLSRELPYPTPAQGVGVMTEMISELTRRGEIRLEDVWGIGVASPGPFDPVSGVLNEPYDFPGWDGVPLIDELRRATGRPIYLEKDASAAAIGERWQGAGTAYTDFLYIYLGMGLGGGLILGGQSYRGTTGLAADLAQVATMMEGADPAPNGVTLARLYQTLAQTGIIVRQPGELSVLYRQGHPAIQDWLSRTADVLLLCLRLVNELLKPQAFLFGGRLPADLTDILITEMRQRLITQPSSALTAVFERGALQDHSACVGAAIRPLFEEISPQPTLLIRRATRRR